MDSLFLKITSLSTSLPHSWVQESPAHEINSQIHLQQATGHGATNIARLLRNLRIYSHVQKMPQLARFLYRVNIVHFLQHSF